MNLRDAVYQLDQLARPHSLRAHYSPVAPPPPRPPTERPIQGELDQLYQLDQLVGVRPGGGAPQLTDLTDIIISVRSVSWGAPGGRRTPTN